MAYVAARRSQIPSTRVAMGGQEIIAYVVTRMGESSWLRKGLVFLVWQNVRLLELIAYTATHRLLGNLYGDRSGRCVERYAM